MPLCTTERFVCLIVSLLVCLFVGMHISKRMVVSDDGS